MANAPARRFFCDLAVMGGGLAGLVTALRAAQLGLIVRVFERLPEDRYVCNSRLTGGIFHVALNRIDDPAQTLAERIDAATDGTAHPGLARAISDDAMRLIRWLQDAGIRFICSGAEPYQAYTLAPPALPQFGRQWEGRGGDVMLRTLEAELNRKSGAVKRGYAVHELTERDGCCVGLRGTDQTGEAFFIDARAVVIADGGFQANPAALAEHVSPRPDLLCQRNARASTGDGMRLAREIGAAVTGLHQFYGHVMSRDALTNENLWPYPWADELARSGILVGPDARRFTDEGRGGVDMANAIARQQDPGACVAIFDDAIWQGPGCARALSANPYLVRGGATLHSAHSIAELAARAGLPADALTAEVADHNESLERESSGQRSPPRSTDRYKPWPIRQAPFQALPVVAGITYTMGGIRIDEHARALDETGRPIPGLYATGACTGGLEGGPRTGYVGGLVKCGVTGLRAAEHVAAQAMAEEIP